MNEKNLDFYNNLGVNTFKDLAIAGGFSTFKDLEQIYPIIKNSSSILELGAGYGRCIEFLLEKRYSGKIIAIEQSASLMAHLKENFRHIQNIELLQEDVKSVKLSHKVDHVLWMWSGIIDFSKEQQIECLSKLNGMLNENGKVIIDIPRLGYQTIAEHKDEKNLFFNTPYGTLNCFIPDDSDMEEARVAGGFSNLEKLNYETATDKKRTIYILTK